VEKIARLEGLRDEIVRLAYSSGRFTQLDLAEVFDLSARQLCRIIAREPSAKQRDRKHEASI
jgi:hypothetical protein